MKIFLDDARDPPKMSLWENVVDWFNVNLFGKPTQKWALARDPEWVCFMVTLGVVKEISFDHDLGEGTWSGYDLARRIEELAYFNKVKRIKWQVHSANPVGRKNIEAAMKKADEYWDGHERVKYETF